LNYAYHLFFYFYCYLLYSNLFLRTVYPVNPVESIIINKIIAIEYSNYEGTGKTIINYKYYYNFIL